MADQSVTRRLAAIVAVDVVDYSRFIRADEEVTLAHLKAANPKYIPLARPPVTTQNGLEANPRTVRPRVTISIVPARLEVPNLLQGFGVTTANHAPSFSQ